MDQVVIGTHGSLKNWIGKRLLPLKFMRQLVFDEADEMLKVRLVIRHVAQCDLLGRPPQGCAACSNAYDEC